MKKLIFLLIVLVVSVAPVSNYCDGWKEGYKAGYCFEKQGCVSPVAPVCPVPKVGFETYKDGYNRGFVKGKKDRK